MTDKAIQLRRDYYKKWNEQNRDKRRLYIERYWEKKARGQENE